jgi:hypothetical protein
MHHDVNLKLNRSVRINYSLALDIKTKLRKKLIPIEQFISNDKQKLSTRDKVMPVMFRLFHHDGHIQEKLVYIHNLQRVGQIIFDIDGLEVIE